MGDTPFNIPPAKRREPKQFEPPPWERETFGESAPAVKPAQPETPAAAQPKTEREMRPAKETSPAEQAVTRQTTEAEGQPSEGPAQRRTPEEGEAEKSGKAALDEAMMIEMFARLAEEEEPVAEGLWKVALAVALVLGALGGVLVIWGMAAAIGSRTGGATAAMGGAILLLFGAGFIAAAVWLTLRTLRQRGVL